MTEHREVGVDVEGEAVPCPPARDLDADRGDLLVAHPHPGEPAVHRRLHAEIGERVDEHPLERAHVRDDVARALAPLRQRDDRVADELTRAVVRDVAAAVGVHEIGADRRRRHEHVRRVGACAERVDVGVLEQEQVVITGSLVERPLECVGIRVRDAAEPSCPERHPRGRGQSSSDAQSWCSIRSRIAPRNAAAYAPSNAR